MEDKVKKETKDNDRQLKVPLKEKSRIYIFPNNQQLKIDDAVECNINKNNNLHTLQDKAGAIYIVPYRWLGLKIIDK